MLFLLRNQQRQSTEGTDAGKNVSVHRNTGYAVKTQSNISCVTLWQHGSYSRPVEHLPLYDTRGNLTTCHCQSIPPCVDAVTVEINTDTY